MNSTISFPYFLALFGPFCRYLEWGSGTPSVFTAR